MVERARAGDRPSGAAAAFRVLASPPTPRQRAAILRELDALLRWQQTLRAWPTPRAGLDATPFVSIYAAGRTLGCFGSTEGPPAARLSRAFLRAVEDARFGGVDAAMRGHLAAQVSYPAHVREVTPEDAPDLLELGLEGVVVATRDARASVVLPHVARDARLDARGLVDLAAQKAGLTGAASLSGAARVWLFDTHDVVAWRHGAPATRRGGLDLAARWLSRLVGEDGAVAFAVDPRTAARVTVGDLMHHGRAAVVIAALARRGGHAAIVKRARARLARDVAAAMSGEGAPAWPTAPGEIAGTLALAVLAGVDVRDHLEAYVEAHAAAIAAAPWHAAQVALALGPTPRGAALLSACVGDLARRAWAPWTALAARRHGAAGGLRVAEAALVASLRRGPPHVGGADVTPVPEIALTAVAVEALAEGAGAAVRAAVARGRAFLASTQLLGQRLGAAYDPDAALGAFPISPAFDVLRCDVTAHALLALIPAAPIPRAP